MRLLRDQRSVVVGTSDTRLLGPNPKRKSVVISAPPVGQNAQTPDGAQSHNASSAAAGVILTYTVPAGQQGVLDSASCIATVGGTQAVALQITRGGTTTFLFLASPNGNFVGPLALLAGDIIQWNVTTAVAATTVDVSIFVRLNPTQSRVSVEFNGPAVLDQGITLYPGTLPFQLVEEYFGQAIHEEVRAIASVAGVNVNILEFFTD
jgi:hypothetical protein